MVYAIKFVNHSFWQQQNKAAQIDQYKGHAYELMYILCMYAHTYAYVNSLQFPCKISDIKQYKYTVYANKATFIGTNACVFV